MIWINPVEPHTTGPSVTAPLTEFDGAENGIGGGGAWRDKLVPASQCIATSTVTRALNWKIAVEQFLEGYHIRSTHRETFFPLQYDNLNIVETFGPNSRITYPYRNIERLRDRPTDTWRVKRRVTFVYQLFPNVMVATFPDRVSVIVVDPVDVGHCTLTTFTLTDPTDTPTRAITDDKQSAVMSRRSSGETLINAGTIEDNAMSLAVQRGLQAGANEYVEFGRHESAIGHFHRHLDARLTGASAASAASAASQ